MDSWLKASIPKILNKYDLKISSSENEKNIVDKLAFYIYNMVFNICALVATITNIYDPEHKKVKPKHIQMALSYVKQQCYPKVKHMKGGNFDSEYFGKESGAYQSSSSGTVMNQVNFQNQIARPELNMSGGKQDEIFAQFTMLVLESTKKEELFPSSKILEIFHNFDTQIKKNSLKIIKQILKMHLNCFMTDLHDKGNLTISKLEDVANMSRHAVFL